MMSSHEIVTSPLRPKYNLFIYQYHNNVTYKTWAGYNINKMTSFLTKINFDKDEI